MNEEDEKIDLVFLCKLEKTHIVTNLLSAINIKKDTV
jgi:hypothetical protein